MSGGFLEEHESWQQGGAREVREETGAEIDVATILPMWFVMEAAGMIAIVSYFLTGVTATAGAIGISIGAFIWYGPRAFVKP